jgi:hypothetical protein
VFASGLETLEGTKPDQYRYVDVVPPGHLSKETARTACFFASVCILTGQTVEERKGRLLGVSDSEFWRRARAGRCLYRPYGCG